MAPCHDVELEAPWSHRVDDTRRMRTGSIVHGREHGEGASSKVAYHVLEAEFPDPPTAAHENRLEPCASQSRTKCHSRYGSTSMRSFARCCSASFTCGVATCASNDAWSRHSM